MYNMIPYACILYGTGPDDVMFANVDSIPYLPNVQYPARCQPDTVT